MQIAIKQSNEPVITWKPVHDKNTGKLKITSALIKYVGVDAFVMFRQEERQYADGVATGLVRHTLIEGMGVTMNRFSVRKTLSALDLAFTEE